MITGHCSLRKHLHKIGKATEPDCRLCGMDDETAFHILCECPATERVRITEYDKPKITTEDIIKEPKVKMAKFLKEANLLQ